MLLLCSFWSGRRARALNIEEIYQKLLCVLTHLAQRFSLGGLFDSVGREEVEGTSVFHVQRSVESFSVQINVRFSLLTYVRSVWTCYGSVATAETSVCLFYFRLKFWPGFSVHNLIPTTPALPVVGLKRRNVNFGFPIIIVPRWERNTKN